LAVLSPALCPEPHCPYSPPGIVLDNMVALEHLSSSHFTTLLILTIIAHSPRRRGFRNNARKVPKVSGRCGCHDDVRTTPQARCRRCAEVHFRVQILLSTKISTRKLFDVRNMSKYPEGFRNDKDSVDRLRIFNFYFPRVVRALVDARHCQELYVSLTGLLNKWVEPVS